MADTVFLHPRLGLCNRWRAMLSALGLARLTGRDLRILWQPATYCKCRAEQLWQLPQPDVTLCEPADWDAHPRAATYGPKIAHASTLDSGTIRVTTFALVSADLTRPLDQWLPYLPIHPELTAKADAYFEKFLSDATQTIGLCIRSSAAHPNSTRVTPVRWFVQRAKQLAEQYPDARFFLGCDAAATEAGLRAVLKDRLRIYPRSSYRGGHPSIPLESMINILILAKLQYLVGSHYSSYSRMPTILSPDLPGEFCPADAPAQIPWRAV